MSDFPYVDLNRRFQKLVLQEDEDPASLDLEDKWDWLGYRNKEGWSDLEKRFRTVILAEGGSGKTCEMEERCKALKTEGHFAFFLPLEALVDESVDELLELVGNLQDFKSWKDNSEKTAWFYLDAVDELKLKDGSFKKSLQQLKRALRDEVMRARIVISCRPSDWEKIDIRYFEELFPAPIRIEVKKGIENSESEEISHTSSDERFLAPLKGSPGLHTDLNTTSLSGKNEANPEKLVIYSLCSLDEAQIRTFIEASDLGDAEGLLSEIEKEDRWDFARRPQDLLELIALWVEKKSLGSYTEQQESFLLASLRDRDGRPAEKLQISQQKARRGAERLAFALTLTKKRTIANPSSSSDLNQNASSLKATDVLTDWKLTDIKSLLRLRLFDPPTFDRVRFHRRDVEAFLAAGHLNRLAKSGNSAKRQLLELLFTQTRSGRQIVIPSKQSIVVWLAQGATEFNDIVRKNVIEIEPELLLNAGDQQQYSLADKIQILDAVVRRGSNGRRKSLSFSEASLRRFSTPDLEWSIRSGLQGQDTPDSVCCLLLGLIKEGKLAACGDLLENIAVPQGKPTLQRVLALQGLLYCEDNERIRRIADAIVDEPQSWPSEVLEHVLADLVPEYIEVTGLLEILRVLHFEGADGSGSFPKELQRISTKIDPNNGNARELREGLARLITGNQSPGSYHFHPISEYAWLSPALSTLCLRQAPLIKPKGMRDFFFTCMTAKSFKPESYYGADDVSKLCKWVGSSGLERKQLFLWELEFTLARFSSLRANSPLVIQNSFVSQISEEDEGWLTEIALDTRTDVKIRLSALLEIIRAWNAIGRPESKIEPFRALGAGDKILQGCLTNWLKEKNIDEPEEEWKEQQRQYDEKEVKRLDGWLLWRQDLVDSPKKYFSEKELPRTRHLLLEWLLADNSSNGSYQLWSGGKGIEEAFGKEVRDSASETFRAFWRSVDYRTLSERKDDQTGTTYTWLFGLTGVLAEADEKNWVATLTDEDIGQAARLAMIEINGFPRFLDELVAAKPDRVAETLGVELDAQLGMIAEVQHLPLLQDLTGGNRGLKVLLVDRLIDFMLVWDEPTNISDESCGYLNHNFSQIFRVILEVRSEIAPGRLDAIIERCVQRLRESPLSQFAGMWFRVLFTTNAETATSLLEKVIKSLEEDQRRDKVIAWLGKLFGDYQPVKLSLEDDDARARILARLIKIAYAYVLPSEDQERIAGIAYTPNSRDEAESARNSLVNQLSKISGPVADEEIQRLASDPVCEKVGGYLKGRSEIREVQSADMARFTISEIHGIEADFEVMPKDRDSLFRVMMSRLDDLQDNISHHDFVPRRTLQSIDSEEEMQRMLALLLQGAANGAYSIHREPEVVDKKRTDIQFSVPGANVESVIEIKVAEKSAWTVVALLDALENQLVKKYLRYETRKAGCLLLTYGGYTRECEKCEYKKKPRQYWKHPMSKKHLDFPELIALLQQRANEIESERSGEIRLAVFGLDLRDPSNRSRIHRRLFHRVSYH